MKRTADNKSIFVLATLCRKKTRDVKKLVPSFSICSPSALPRFHRDERHTNVVGDELKVPMENIGPKVRIKPR